MGEAGLFGVICLCHRLRMSVAKFCEVLKDRPNYFVDSTFQHTLFFFFLPVTAIHFMSNMIEAMYFHMIVTACGRNSRKSWRNSPRGEWHDYRAVV